MFNFMKKSPITHVLLFIILFIPLAVNAICINDGDEVEFSGQLRKELFYGPPGFGEDKTHDSKEYYWILYTDKSIDCIADIEKSNDEWDRAFQLDLSDKKQYEGVIKNNNRVHVKGKIQLAEAPTDNTPAIITDIISITLSSSGEY